jgi:hypothetical protein
MAKQTLMWTALPNGYTEDGLGLRVSLLLSPRLDPEGDKNVLKTFFPDLHDWPQVLAASDTVFVISYGGRFVKIPGDQLVGASRIDDHYFGAAFGPAFGWGDGTLWKELFTAATPVQKFEYQDLSTHDVLSYDTREVHDVVRNLYRRLASAAGDAMPTIGNYLGDPGWKPLVEVARQLDDRPGRETPDRLQFVNQATGLRDPARMYAAFAKNQLTFTDPLLGRFARFELFHTPMMRPKPVVERKRSDDPRIVANSLEYEKSALPKPGDFAKKIDFHQIAAAMNSYPVLLRKLGLVVDLIVDRSEFKFAPDAALWAGVELPKTGGTARRAQVSPVTRAKFDKTHWQAARQKLPKPGDSRVLDGLLELDPKQFDLVQVDVDGAGTKVMNFARSLLRHSEKKDLRFDPTTRKEDEAGAPALRNAGLMLTHHDRWSMLKNRFADNKKRNDAAEAIAAPLPKAKPPVPEFWAEDLVRGYRIDIRDSKTGKWRSLCERNAKYRIGSAVLSGVAEEGIVRLAATQPVDATVVPDLTKLHEALVCWNGWSLAARQPGLAIPPDDKISGSNPAESAPALPPGLNFTSDFVAKSGSLPRLRYGREYALRARVVDLAGNSLTPREDDIGVALTQTTPQTYLRYEPVMPPAIALVQPAPGEEPLIPHEGESMERMAIRSFNKTPADNAILITATAERFAVPVQISIRDAELHGALDTSGAIDPSLYTTLVDKDAPLTDVKLPMPRPTDPAPVDVSFAVLEIGSELSYLPDPMAVLVAARFFDHPGIGPEKVFPIQLYPNGRRWPDAQAIRIHCYEDASTTAAPKLSETSGGMLLRVPLPKSARVQLRLSTVLSKSGLEQLGIWQWLLNSPEWAALVAKEKNALLTRALNGQHWMLSPWRTMELVHAVQRPLLIPDFPKHSATTLFKFASRTRGDTFVWPMFIGATHIASTERLDLMAEWHEPLDTVAAGPSDQLRIDRAFSVRLTTPQTYESVSAKTPGGGVPEHDILPPGSTTVSAGAADGGVVAPDLIGVPPARAALERAHVRTGNESSSRLVHEFHDTRYRRIEYWMVGTTRFREYLPQDVLVDAGKPTEKNISISVDSVVPSLPRHVTWVPSSAPPPAPSVLYVVPTFGWVEGEADDGRVTRWRRGGGLRVYLDRPWSASGYGEMLAVVLPPAGFKEDPEVQPKPSTYKKVITQWGNDPAWDSPFVAGLAPKRGNFPLARWKPDPTGAWLPRGAVSDAHWNEADQQPGDFAVTGLKATGLDDPAPNVEIAPHDVYFDDERQLWFCDIEIQAGASYYPFIRLALARYQPCAIPEAHLSNIVLADFMALTPDRSLTVAPTRSAQSRRVTVYGNRPRQSAGFAEAASSPALTEIDLPTGRRRDERPADISKTTVIELWVERLTPQQGLDFGWHRVYDAVVTPVRPVPSSIKSSAKRKRKTSAPAATMFSAKQQARALELVEAQRYTELANEGLIAVLLRAPLWDGTVTLPNAPTPDARYRIVIAEYEEYLTDDVPSPGFPNVAYDTPPESKGRRLVFVEHVELDFS